jgi:thiol-disulfide isomerase/thioredoxin
LQTLPWHPTCPSSQTFPGSLIRKALQGMRVCNPVHHPSGPKVLRGRNKVDERILQVTNGRSGMKRILLLGFVGLIFAAPRGWAYLWGPGDRVLAMSAVDAADTVKASTGRPTVILLYSTSSPICRAMFPQFADLSRRARDAGATVLAFSTDSRIEARDVPGLLADYGVQVTPYWIRPWAPGEFDLAFQRTGILVGTQWTRPLLAIRAADGRILYEAQGTQADVGRAEAALGEALTISQYF